MLRHFGALAFARGMSALAQAVLLVLLARAIGPHDFGVLSVFFSVQFFVFTIAGLNAHTYIAREVATKHDGAARAALSLNAITLSGALAAAALGALLLWSEPALMLATWANAVALFFEGRTETRLAISFARREIVPAASAIGGRAALSIALYLGLAAVGVDLLLAYTVARFAAASAGWLVARLAVRSSWTQPAARRSRTFAEQLPLAVSIATGSVRNLDNLVVTAVANAATAGVYAAATRLLSPFAIVPSAMTSLVVPRAAQASTSAVRRYADLVFAVGIALSLLTLVTIPFTEWIVTAVFGESFAGGGPVLTWVLLRLGTTCCLPVLVTMLQAKKLDREVAINSTLVAITILPAVAVGAVLAGAAGAAAAFAAISILSFVRMWFVGRRRLRAQEG